MKCRWYDKRDYRRGIKPGVDDYVDSIHRFCDRICLDDYKQYLDDLDIAYISNILMILILPLVMQRNMGIEGRDLVDFPLYLAAIIFL
jgi:hypothetical protein